MIRDTFETNPGLCELFKRKILERAGVVGLSEYLIDFDAQIDMKGTYQDNLRIIYRQYPQLSQNSDYFRIKSIRPLNDAALEQSWRSFKRNNGHEIPKLPREPTEQPLMPELVITYTIGRESEMARNQAPKEPISIKPIVRQDGANPSSSTYRELVKSLLDRVTALAGEKVTRMILHQIRQETSRTASNYSRNQTLTDNIVDALDDVLSIRR